MSTNNYMVKKNANDKSRETLDTNLEQYLLMMRRQWKPALAIFITTLSFAGCLSLDRQKTYQAEGKLLFKNRSTASYTGIGADNVNLESILANQTPLNTQIQILESEGVIQQVIDRKKLTNRENKPLKPTDFRRKLTTKLIGGSDVVEIKYSDPNPKKASKIVNTLMDVYLQEQIKENQSKPTAAKEFIDRELPNLESKVTEAESNISAFRTNNNIIDLVEEKKEIVSSLAISNQQISTANSQLEGLKAQTASLQSQLGLDLDRAIAINLLGASPEVKSILEQLTKTESRLAQERQRFKNEHPSIASLQSKKNDLTRQLTQLISNTVGQDINVAQGLLATEDGNGANQLEKFIDLKIDELNQQQQIISLYQSQEKYLARAEKIPRLEKEERELIRNAKAANKTYKTLLNSLQEVQIAENQQSGNIEIVEYAFPPERGNSPKMILLSLGVIVGAFLANISAIVLETQDNSIKSLAAIKNKFNYQIIGILPLERSSDRGKIITKEEPDSFYSELYRMIQANLKFVTSNKPPKVILVTSSVPQEGKSTIAANLSAAISQLNRKVLLIDGDLRRSSQHFLWQVNNDKGIEDITLKDRQLESTIKPVMPQLSLLTSGKIKSNPLASIDSASMGKLVASARKEYDLILIDAPPLAVTADILTWSKLVDGIIFVARPGIVEYESAELAGEVLQASKTNVLGMIINGVKDNDFYRYSYQGKYGKSYHHKKNSLNEL